MITDFLLDQSSISRVSRGCSTAADVLLPKYAVPRKIHPPEVSAHISNGLLPLESTSRIRGVSEKYAYRSSVLP